MPITDSFARTAIPLDCVGDQCGDTIYEQGNYQAWPFFAYLGERFGTQIVKEIHDRGPALGDPNALGLDFVDQVLTAKGAHLADVFNDWTTAAMSGSYVATGLKGTTPQTWTTLATGISGGQLAPTTVSVNHLSVRYVASPTRLRRQLGAVPPRDPDTERRTPGRRPLPTALLLAGDRQCPDSTRAHRLHRNPQHSVGHVHVVRRRASSRSRTPAVSADGVDFTVSGTLTVDKNSLATSTPPPAGSYTGPVVSSPVGDEPPSIALYGPETLRVSKKKRVVRVVVFSSGDGRLNASLGALSLGARSLRTGNNDLRFTLPRNVTRTLAAVSRLTLTSVSPDGHARRDRHAQARPDEVTSRASARTTASSSQSPTPRLRRVSGWPSRTSSTPPA